MPAWIPALKAALPYLRTIATNAIPVWTALKTQGKAADVNAEQIGELQKAVTHNAQSIKELAEQLTNTVKVVEEGANSLEQTLGKLDLQLTRQAELTTGAQQQIADLNTRLAHARTLALISIGMTMIALAALLLHLLR